jgi:NADH-quinone oxidoreductase subunit H
MAINIFYFLVFPGLLFASVIGAFLSWFDRKITARVQFRKGPPVLQPFYDFFKLLLVKETILPKYGSPLLFLLAPIFAVFGASMAGVFILLPLFNITTGFRGDLLVIFYLLTIPSFSYIIGALASGNPLAAVGASREMKLILSYELTFLLVIAGIIMKCGQQFNLYSIIQEQQSGSPFIASVSGVLLFIAGIFCIQAKLALVPFDMPEAEAEITEGIFIEYSGTAYAMIKLAKYIMFFYTSCASDCIIDEWIHTSRNSYFMGYSKGSGCCTHYYFNKEYKSKAQDQAGNQLLFHMDEFNRLNGYCIDCF